MVVGDFEGTPKLDYWGGSGSLRSAVVTLERSGEKGSPTTYPVTTR